MNLAVRDAVVTGYEPLIGSLHLPDPDDRHVLAAAIRARAQIIVTFNLNDFPAEVLADWDVEARHPDDFLVDQFHLDAISVHKSAAICRRGLVTSKSKLVCCRVVPVLYCSCFSFEQAYGVS